MTSLTTFVPADLVITMGDLFGQRCGPRWACKSFTQTHTHTRSTESMWLCGCLSTIPHARLSDDNDALVKHCHSRSIYTHNMQSNCRQMPRQQLTDTVAQPVYLLFSSSVYRTNFEIIAARTHKNL